MSELFIELFSEEVPAKLQIKAREQLKELLSNFFEQHGANIKVKSEFFQHQTGLLLMLKAFQKKFYSSLKK